jgi:hypothetical protein
VRAGVSEAAERREHTIPGARPVSMATKLRQLRPALGLSQTEMLRRLGLEEGMKYVRISE